MRFINKRIVKNHFVFGEGTNGIYSDLTIEINKGEATKLKRGQNIELIDEELLKSIENLLSNWIEYYSKKSINLEITILDVGIDKTGRKYAIENSVNGIMHDALQKLGINPPQIFSE